MGKEKCKECGRVAEFREAFIADENGYYMQYREIQRRKTGFSNSFE